MPPSLSAANAERQWQPSRKHFLHQLSCEGTNTILPNRHGSWKTGEDGAARNTWQVRTCLPPGQLQGQNPPMWHSGNSGVFWRLAASRGSLAWQSVVNFGQSVLSVGSGYPPLNPESLDGVPHTYYLSTLHTAYRNRGGYKRPCTDIGARHPGAWSQVGLRKHNYEQG